MVKKQIQDEELKRKIRDDFFTASEGHSAIIALEKELDRKIEPVKLGVKHLTSEKNTYIAPSEKEQIRKESDKLISKIKHEYWETMLDAKRSIGEATLADLIKSVGRKAPFEVTIDEASKLIVSYNSRMATREYLEENLGLQPVVRSLGGRQIGGYTHSVFNDLTMDDIKTIISGWKEGKEFDEIAKNLNVKSAFYAMNEKKIIAIMRGIVISGVREGNPEGLEAVVNSVFNETELSEEDRKKYKLSNLDYKGMRNSVEIVLAMNPLATALEFFKKNYHELELDEKGVSVRDDLIRIGPEYIKNLLKNKDAVAIAVKINGGAGALKRFNLDESGMPYMDAEGRNKEISTSGRMAAMAFMQPWDIPFRMLMFEQMVPSSNREVVIDGMKSEQGRELWKKLEDREHLGLCDKDSFVIFVTTRDLAGHAMDLFKERMEDVQEKGGKMLSEYVEGRLLSGDSVATIKNDMHPFIQTEIEIAAFIAREKLKREKIDDG